MPSFRMSRAGRSAAGMLALWLFLGAVSAVATETGDSPGLFVRDDARLFDAAAAEEMNRMLAESRRATGVSVYVAASSFLEGGGMREHAHALVGRWLAGEPGLLIAYNRGNSLPAIAASPEFWRRYPVDEVTQMFAEIGRVLAMVRVPPDLRLRDAAELAVNRVGRMEEDRRLGQRLFTRADARLAAVVAAALAVGGVAIWFLGWRWRRTRRAVGEKRYVFPDVAVAPRLGAPFGGGVVGGSNAPQDR